MLKTQVKGEITVVISEKNIKDKFFDKQKVIKKAKMYLKKYSLKDTVQLIFETKKLTKEIYKICLKLKMKKLQ